MFRSSFRAASALDASPWLVNNAPSLSKVVDLPDNTLPASNNIDCAYENYLPTGQTAAQTLCTFSSPLGTLTANSMIVTGVSKLTNLYGPDYKSAFLQTVDDSVAVVSITSPGIGNYIGVYRHLSKAALQEHITANMGMYYDVSAEPDAMLRDPAAGGLLEIDTTSIAYSANGKWMVVDLPHRGLLRVNMQDLSTQLFAAPLEPSWYLGLANPALAISNDGRYAAANTDIFGNGSLDVYDLTTCTDQLDAATNQQQYCNGKDIWNGLTADSQPMGQGLLSQEADLAKPTHLRFIDDDSISFNARYLVTSASAYKAASFVATAPGGVEHKLGLLGMGDSYISGQGEFDYRDGTDTANNTCHLSPEAYPFILGAEYFNSSNSVACSGAITNDVSTTSSVYKGQVRDGTEWKDRSNKAQIIDNFAPGYASQTQFASAYQPEAILLSVAGDDIGFSTIVKDCVANEGGGTCYNTYEDRAELVNEIDNTYGKLVNTYTAIRQQSGGSRLYVVGYPQIAKPGGACGLNVHLNDTEVEFSNQLVSYLDGVIEQAAHTAGAFYVDTQQAFSGHELCEPGDKAMNGLTAGGDTGVSIAGKTVNFIGAESYHPTQLGHRLLAATIAAKTANLTAPMPSSAPYAVPQYDSAIPLLTGVPSTGRPINWVTNDDSMVASLEVIGDAQQVTVNGSDIQLQPGSKYQVVLHSDPILLDEGGVNVEGNIATTVHIPAGTPPGYHVLHVYGTNMAGEAVDVQKVVYVAASANDYDGDGVPNSANPCLVVPLSGQDTDRDGVDDACDPSITAAPTQTSVSGNVMVGQPTDKPGSVSGVSGVAPSSVTTNQNPAGAVLGDSFAAAGPATAQRLANISMAPSAQQLFRVDWTKVLEVGLICTTSSTVLYCWLRRGQ